MNINAVRHNVITDCYAYDENTLIIKLETGKEVTGVNVIFGDPFTGWVAGRWKGENKSMPLKCGLKHSLVWETSVAPKYKRLMYYFEIVSENERIYFFEDGVHDNVNCGAGKMLQYFRFAWLNPSDICIVPKWAEDVVWYQIFPDRFCRAECGKGKLDILPWGEEKNARFYSFYGGNLRGIIEKLGYINDLGVNGLYLTPIMRSDTNHRYNVHDYTLIDPELGSENDLKELLDKAHAMGMKIMLDAVFNHCGTEFFAWKDVVKNGKNSKYYDWFFINSPDFVSRNQSTEDGRYYSFAFVSYMPKLNTNNPEVMDYLIGVCKNWLKLGIDGIRFDVGNEVSHTFLKKLRIELKAIKPDVYLLGELWHRSQAWLMGDQYDSIMNFQFLESVNGFQIDKSESVRELMYSFNEMYNNYYRQVNAVLFNMIDNHDVARAVTRCGSVDGVLQELVMLMTMPGSPSIYYGTEICLSGEERESRNRRCMDWRGIESGKYAELITDFKQIVALRKDFLKFKGGEIEWKLDKGERIVNYIWKDNTGHCMEIILNASDKSIEISARSLLYSRKLEGNKLLPYGIAVYCR